MTLRALLLPLLILPLAACGGGNDATSAAAPAGDGGALYREGTHYTRLATPLPASANEVVEVFSYACPACGQFQGEVDAWKRERGEAVHLRYVPAEFHPAWAPFAQAYYTFVELGALGRLHRATFDALYRQGRPLATLEDIAGVAETAGIPRERFLAVAQSPEVAAALAQAREYVQSAQIGSTPTLVVSGRYRVERAQPGNAKALEVADWLIEHQP